MYQLWVILFTNTPIYETIPWKYWQEEVILLGFFGLYEDIQLMGSEVFMEEHVSSFQFTFQAHKLRFSFWIKEFHSKWRVQLNLAT